MAGGALPYPASVEGRTHGCEGGVEAILVKACDLMVVASLVNIVVANFNTN